MPSPDLTPYVDLTAFDLAPSELALLGAAVLADRYPGWTPREANIEVLLLEVAGEVTANIVNALNRIPGAVLESLLFFYGVDRSTGTPATTAITIVYVDTLGHTLPAGTVFRVNADTGDDPAEFTLDTAAAAAPGAATVTVAATAVAAGSTPNGVPAGTTATTAAANAVQSATLAADVAGGTDPEDSTSYLERASERLRRLTSTLVLPEHFTAAALENPAVYRALTLDLYNADTELVDTGHVTVAVRGPAGVALSGPQLATLLADLEVEAAAFLAIHVINATITAIDVHASIVVVDGADPAVVTAAVVDRLAAYLNPDAWEWSGTVYRNELIAVVDGVDGVDRVVDIYEADDVTPFTDTALAGAANLVSAGDIDATEAP